MSTGSDTAVKYFNSGYNCAQSVLNSHCAEYGLDEETALKVSCAFGGGISHTGEICGAVTGALMLISLKYGKHRPEDNDAKDITYSLVQKYLEMFKEKHGSIKCSDLAGYDLSTEEGLKQARESGVFSKVCVEMIRDSVLIAEKLI